VKQTTVPAKAAATYLNCFDREWTPDLPGVAVNPLEDATAPVLSAM